MLNKNIKGQLQNAQNIFKQNECYQMVKIMLAVEDKIYLYATMITSFTNMRNIG